MASPVVLVKKKDVSVRFSMDYRLLNSMTKKGNYTMFQIDALADCRVLSILDLNSGYYKVGLVELVVPED